MDTDIDTLIRDTATRLFRDRADLQAVVLAKDDGWQDALWRGIEANGLTLAAVPEQLGGAGAGLGTGLGLLRAAGNAALAVPLAETLLAGWLLAQGGIAAPTGKLAFGPAGFDDRLALDAQGRLSGRIARLPFAGDCSAVALLAAQGDRLQIVLVGLGQARLTPIRSLAYEPADLVEFDAVVPLDMAAAPAGFTPDTTLLLGAAARSMQIAGALEEMLGITTAYVQDRPAFGKTLSKFQAVQHALAQLAGETAAALSAAASAIETLDSLLVAGRGFDDPELRLEVIAARIRTSAAATTGSRIAHQMHGAIGVTDEHVLHRLTLRALAWRDDYGNESQWAESLGQMVSDKGGDGLWALLAQR